VSKSRSGKNGNPANRKPSSPVLNLSLNMPGSRIRDRFLCPADTDKAAKNESQPGRNLIVLHRASPGRSAKAIPRRAGSCYPYSNAENGQKLKAV